MRKAKEKLHPMPKLGWQDTLLYWSGFILCAVGMIAAFAIPLMVRGKQAFVHPDVIAATPIGGDIHFLWLYFWFMTMSGGQNIQKVIDYYHMTQTEIDLLYEIF